MKNTNNKIESHIEEFNSFSISMRNARMRYEQKNVKMLYGPAQNDQDVKKY